MIWPLGPVLLVTPLLPDIWKFHEVKGAKLAYSRTLARLLLQGTSDMQV